MGPFADHKEPRVLLHRDRAADLFFIQNFFTGSLQAFSGTAVVFEAGRKNQKTARTAENALGPAEDPQILPLQTMRRHHPCSQRQRSDRNHLPEVRQ